MAEAKDLIIGGLALVGGVSVAREAVQYGINRTIENITYALGRANVSLADIRNGNLHITLPVFILNENEVSISIDKFLGDVSYGVVPLGNILIPDQFTLVTGESIALNLFFTANIQNTVQGVFNAAQNGGYGAILDKIYLKGELFVLGGSFFGQVKLPIETTISII